MLAMFLFTGFFANALAGKPTATFGIVKETPAPYGTKTVVGCSADGSVLVGDYQNPSSVPDWLVHPYRRSGNITEDLGSLAGLTSSSGSAKAISSDGLVVVGRCTAIQGRSAVPDTPSDTVTQGGAFRWTSATGMQPLFVPPNRSSTATDVSADGSVVVGSYRLVAGSEAGNNLDRGFRWTSSGSASLEPLPGYTRSAAAAVSDDGTVTVGASSAANLASQACVWMADGSVSGLGSLAGTEVPLASAATNVSTDGAVVIGTSTTSKNFYKHGFRWTAGGGLQDLGEVIPRALSGDGSVVAADDDGGNVYRWDAEHGLENLRTLLLAAGAEVRGIRLSHIIAISADGETFFGKGFRDSFIDGTGSATGINAELGPRSFFVWKAFLPLSRPTPATANAPVFLLSHRIKKINAPDTGNHIMIRGSAAGPVVKVTYRVGKKGPFKRAKGRRSWHFTPNLHRGRNVITIIAHGPGGDSAPVKVIVTRLGDSWLRPAF